MAIVGRNYILRPRNVDPADGSWAAQVYGTTDILMNANFNTAPVDLPGLGETVPVQGGSQTGATVVRVDGAELLPGRRVKFGVWYRNTAGAADVGRLMLTPHFPLYSTAYWVEVRAEPWGAARGAIGANADKLMALTIDLPKSTEFTYIESEPLEIPDFSAFSSMNAHGSSATHETPNDQMTWGVLATNGTVQNVILAAAKVDVETEPGIYEPEWYTGYIDGAMAPQDDGALTFDWSGDAFDSESYATLEIATTGVTAPAPEFTDNTTDGGGYWSTPEVEGVEYTPASGVAAPGETVTVTATALEGYHLEGVTEWTHVFAETPDTPPAPEPGEYLRDVTLKVATALGIDADDDEAMEIAAESTETVILLAYAYCRGNGFSMTQDGGVSTDKPELTAAITAAATRYTANPTGLQYRAGTETVSGAFSGWTLAEQAVFHNYRKRWA